MPQTLLGIDLGIKTGLALYQDNGSLVWYRSQNFGNRTRLKKAVYQIFNQIPNLSILVVEGGGELATIWQREALRRHLELYLISADQWRQLILLPREQRCGVQAKKKAIDAAIKVIIWSEIRRPTSLRHDAAEAILIGLWGVWKVGWLESISEIIH